MIYCIDIDGTICTQEDDYRDAKPIKSRIRAVNRLYDSGHRIIFFTARGYVTKINWREITTDQLKAWGVKYHELIFGKPNADVYIDDKNKSVEVLEHD